MAMNRTGSNVPIQSYSSTSDDALVCKACNRIIPSSSNLEEDDNCPFCHNNVNKSITMSSPLDHDTINNGDIIAESC